MGVIAQVGEKIQLRFMGRFWLGRTSMHGRGDFDGGKCFFVGLQGLALTRSLIAVEMEDSCSSSMS